MARRRLGQHFLIDQSYVGQIIRAARIGGSSTVVEIGPGRGALTGQLSGSAGRLIVIEFDPDLADALREKYADRPHVVVVEADARRVDVSSLPGLESVVYTLVGNLPYYAASPIIRNFLESAHPPESMVVMVQREVANDMVADPGEMSLLSVAVQLYADVEKLFDVPPAAFRPPPKVVSSVVRLVPLARPRVNFDSADDFFRLVKAGFKSPRKQLHNSLSTGLNIPPADGRKLLQVASIESSRRSATLSIAEWDCLYRAWVAADRPFNAPHLPGQKGRGAL
jgi:16S rRNA (adenine1518-N6/adenine1519-N6)-dimethyltransferase